MSLLMVLFSFLFVSIGGSVLISAQDDEGQETVLGDILAAL